ncbi:hypothetical protein [Bacillus sp. 166amftsu]|nr:hypothetical protein [Bacillus sp. 166amftsu]SDZ36512.1 hypothetical protein SAMN04488156_12060 [Bacillus sp. 166amftsu]
MRLKYQYHFTKLERFNDVKIELEENKTLNNPYLITIFFSSDI